MTGIAVVGLTQLSLSSNQMKAIAKRRFSGSTLFTRPTTLIGGRAFDDHAKISVVGYSGLTVDFCHKIGARVIVRGLRVFSDFEYEFRMALANARLAADIDTIALITNEEHSFLSSSTVREIASLGGGLTSMVPDHFEAALRTRFRELGDARQVVPTTSLRD